MDYILTSLDMIAGITENLINYTFNVRRLAAFVYALPDEIMTGHSTGTGKKISPHCMMIGVYIHTISHWFNCRRAVALLMCTIATWPLDLV